MSETASHESNIPIVQVTELWTVIEKGGVGRLGIDTAELGPMLFSIDPDVIKAFRGELTIVESILRARPQGASGTPKPF